MGETTNQTQSPANRRLLFMPAGGLTGKEMAEGATAYEAECQGVKYRIVGSIVDPMAGSRRTFRAYRIVDGGHPVPAGGGRAEKLLRWAKEVAELDLVEVLRDRQSAGTAPTASPSSAWTVFHDTMAAAIRAAEAVRVEAVKQAATDPAVDDDVSELLDRIIRRAKYKALVAMRQVLADWTEGVRSNHEGHGARGPVETCCLQFTPSDIARMVDDAARETRTLSPYESDEP